MTWVKTLQPTSPPHRCVLPQRNDFGVPAQPTGSVWRCDDCGQHWLCRLEFDQREQPHEWLSWSKVAVSDV